MRVLLAAAEVSPWVRTGGLGEAVAGLAGALATAGHDVTVAIPGYGDLDGGSPTGSAVWRTLDDHRFRVVAYADPSFARPGIYGPTPTTSYDDNWERFARFSSAVVDLAEDREVLHLHDAHVGLATLLPSSVPTVFTIHNAAHPVLGPLAAVAAVTGLTGATALGGPLEWYGQANYLKAGIVGASAVTTVSPTHARELAADDASFGLGGVVRNLPRPVVGILNGIDAVSWDPATDPVLAAGFDAGDVAPRADNKAALLAELGLSDGFVLGNVGRMASQKGLQLLDYDVDALVDEGVRFAFVGNGELDAVVDGWAARNRHAVAHRSYTEDLARLLSAGVDAYLMPSLYEPCGLGQLYAMRYGAPPIVRAVGGLADTVIDVDEDASNATGFVFRSFTHASLTKTIRRAIRYHARLPEVWEVIRINGMTADWSWEARAKEYVEVYESVGA